MIVLDGTIVNVALPSIREDLGFSETSLAWVVNAYLLTFGGFLLLAGRLGDLFGARRLFLFGLGLFTLASLACGLANSQEALIGARAVQGLGGAIVASLALALVFGLFTDPGEQAKAMGIFGFVLAGGGSAGVLLGGVLTGLLSWNWIFLVNIPVGIVVITLAVLLVPKVDAREATGRLDLAGAAAITGAIVVAVYATVNGNETGWLTLETLGLLAVAVTLLGAFLVIEARVAAPLMPLGLFRNRNLAVANAIGVMLAAALFAWFFFSALYLQRVLDYTPLEVGLAYLPSTIIWGLVSVLLSGRLVVRYGFRIPIVLGMVFLIGSLLLFTRVPVDGDFLSDVLPATLLFGFGAGIAFNPLLLAAMGDVGPAESGLASGIVNTAFQLGGALGLAIVVSLADARTSAIEGTAASASAALNSGYHVAFLTGAIFGVIGAVLAATLIRSRGAPPPPAPQEPADV